MKTKSRPMFSSTKFGPRKSILNTTKSGYTAMMHTPATKSICLSTLDASGFTTAPVLACIAQPPLSVSATLVPCQLSSGPCLHTTRLHAVTMPQVFSIPITMISTNPVGITLTTGTTLTTILLSTCVIAVNRLLSTTSLSLLAPINLAR